MQYDWRVLSVLLVLWLTMALSGWLAWQQLYMTLAEAPGQEMTHAPQLAQYLSARAADQPAMVNEPMVDEVMASSALQSVFYAAQSEPVSNAPMALEPPDHALEVATEQLSPHSHWLLEVWRPTAADAGFRQQLLRANEQLLAGQFDQAGFVYEQLLQRDPHQVVALAGMRELASQQGDIRRHDEFLDRLYQEIPGYLPETRFTLQTLED